MAAFQLEISEIVFVLFTITSIYLYQSEKNASGEAAVNFDKYIRLFISFEKIKIVLTFVDTFWTDVFICDKHKVSGRFCVKFQNRAINNSITVEYLQSF